MASLSGPAGLVPGADSLGGSIWRPPRLSAARAFTAGVVLDRLLVVPFLVSLLTAAGALIAFAATRLGKQGRLALVYLACSCAAVGAGYHHFRRELYAGDDVGRLV